MPRTIEVLNSTLGNNRLKNSPHYSKKNKWTKLTNLILDLRTWITNQVKFWQDSAHIAEKMDTLSCTAELKPTILRLKDNSHGTTKNAAQFSLMTTLREEDLTLGLRILRILNSNTDTEIITIRHPMDKMLSTQIGTEIQTQIDIVTETHQAILGTTEKRNRQQTQSNFNARPENSDTQYNKNFPRSNNPPTPNPVELIDDQGQDVINTLSNFFPLNFWSLRDQMKEVTSNHAFIWTPSTFPPDTTKKIVHSELNSSLTSEQTA